MTFRASDAVPNFFVLHVGLFLRLFDGFGKAVPLRANNWQKVEILENVVVKKMRRRMTSSCAFFSIGRCFNDGFLFFGDYYLH